MTEPAAASTGPNAPLDLPSRLQIERDLGTTLLVEAAAGTGKTTSLIRRMVALIREDRCAIDKLAAVTFTRNAAAELRARFQVALEREAEAADGAARARLKKAVAQIDRCFLGTIHSFCARLLRERPVEAGVDLAFEELDDATDARIRREAWDEYVASLLVHEAGILDELNELGLEIGQLREAFLAFAEYPDVPDWPAPEVKLPDLRATVTQLVAYAQHMQALSPSFANPGNDKLMPLYRRVARMVRQANLNRPAELMEILETFREDPKIIQKNWPGGKDQALPELERWNTFCQDVAQPLVCAWLARRYAVVLRAIKPARVLYDRRRRLAGGLNFQDLLLCAAELLRDKPAIRRYFRDRFTHLLVDEFQDTDPIQAEVLLLLTAADIDQPDWKQCRPVPGSLFVVGDPKQSIYRFRRADIVTYSEVREIIKRSGGQVLALTTNFRSIGPLIDWVNRTFEATFPAENNNHSPAFVKMLLGRQGAHHGQLSGIHVLGIPDGCANNNDEALEFESDRIAWTIHRAVEERLTVARGSKEQGVDPQARPGDFLIVTRGKKNMTLYGQKLQKLGIPHQITGGATLNEVPELALLHNCLRAVTDPNNAVAVAATLRSPLFGISDTALYAFKRSGGRFSVHEVMPEGFVGPEAEALADALRRLRLYERWLGEMPPVPAFERITADLGLMVRAAAAEGGSVRAGSLAKGFELLRAEQAKQPSLAELVAYLGRLVEPEQDEDRHDGQSTHLPDQAPVRIMNLHKVKGLEAPVVFLADPTGRSDHPIGLHVDRSGNLPPRGYLAIYGEQRGKGAAPLLACPETWDQLTTEEEKFQEAEQHRLNYVAATRAGNNLVITRRNKYANFNPWKFFDDHVNDCPPLELPQAPPPTTRETLEITQAEAQAAESAINDRWQQILMPSYAVIAAKESSLVATDFVPYKSEHRTGWGSVIHELLKAAMAEPSGDLQALASELLLANKEPPDKTDRALAMVRSVTRSDLWKRARASPQRLVEVPFQRLLPAAAADLEAPSLVKGTIDLVFREADGWVVVDFKTHEGRGGRKLKPAELKDFAAQYRPQVLAYATAWKEMTGEPVHQTGLYFTHSEAYIVL